MDPPPLTGGCTYNPTIRLVRSSENTELSVTPPVSNGAGTITLDVENAGTGTGPMGWVAEANDSWLTIESGNYGENSGTITVRYDANAAEETGTITVVAPGAENSPQAIEMSIAIPTLSVAPAGQDVPATDGTTTFTVTTTGTGTINWAAASDASWLTINNASGTITVSYEANPGTILGFQAVEKEPGTMNIANTLTGSETRQAEISTDSKRPARF